MMTFTVLILTVMMPLLFGYLYGFRHVDPNTAEGKLYYAKGETNA